MPSKASILRVPIDQLSAVWPEAFPHLLRGLTAATNLTLQQMVDDLVAGSDQLWVILDGGRVRGAFVTAEFVEEFGDEQGTFLCVYALGGKHMTRWAHELGEEMAREAKSRGCGAVRFCGREAWSRVLPSYHITGQHQGHAVFERAVI